MAEFRTQQSALSIQPMPQRLKAHLISNGFGIAKAMP
jgi:hypothetical protein